MSLSACAGESGAEMVDSFPALPLQTLGGSGQGGNAELLMAIDLPSSAAIILAQISEISQSLVLAGISDITPASQFIAEARALLEPQSSEACSPEGSAYGGSVLSCATIRADVGGLSGLFDELSLEVSSSLSEQGGKEFGDEVRIDHAAGIDESELVDFAGTLQLVSSADLETAVQAAFDAQQTMSVDVLIELLELLYKFAAARRLVWVPFDSRFHVVLENRFWAVPLDEQSLSASGIRYHRVSAENRIIRVPYEKQY